MYISFYSERNPGKILTRETELVTRKNKEWIEKLLPGFNYLYNRALQIIEGGDISKKYQTIYIKKKNGNRRRIDIPNEELKKYQREVVYVFTNKLKFIFPSSIYGYVKGRNRKQMAEVHKNQYQIIKLDIKDFFSSCTLEFVLSSMKEIYPFCMINIRMIRTILIPCIVYFGGEYRLPQGAPTSPMLSNIAMIPIDFTIENEIKDQSGIQWQYTRYADDIIISCGEYYPNKCLSTEEKLLSEIFGDNEKPKILSLRDKYYKPRKIAQRAINSVKENLKKNPYFKLNEDKTKILYPRYGNVWMLGISVGSEVNVGNKNKQKLKAILWTFLIDCKNGKPWTEEETRSMLGKLANAGFIEPKFVINLISKYEQKLQISFKGEVKKILCNRRTDNRDNG